MCIWTKMYSIDIIEYVFLPTLTVHSYMLNMWIHRPILHLKHWNSVVSSHMSTHNIICMICSIPMISVWQIQYLQLCSVYGLSSSSTPEDTSLIETRKLFNTEVVCIPCHNLHEYNKWKHIFLKQPLIIYLLTVSAFSIWTSNSGSWIIDIATGSSLSPGVAIIIFSNTSGRLRRWNRQHF